jgi:Carboxypeptidase regulatory-like domain
MRVSSTIRATAVAILVTMGTAFAASITGTVKDPAGRPLGDVRIDHTGKRVIVTRTDSGIKPSPEEIRTDAEGHFRLVTNVPAIVIRKPGYESQRIRLTEDIDLQVTLTPIRSTSRCKFAVQPSFQTREANDVDYTATWFYIETHDGPQGIISGSGPMYSRGAPDDQQVWTSVEYTEVMYDNGSLTLPAILPTESIGVRVASSVRRRSITTKPVRLPSGLIA